MSARLQGAMLGEASCLAEDATRLLFGVMLRLDEAGLEPSEDVAAVVEAVADISSGLLQLADDYGTGKVLEIEHLRRGGAPA